MANLTETPLWVEGIYQLEENDPVLGGAPNLVAGLGYDNVQAQQLAGRTAYLKAQILALQAQVAGYDGPDPFPTYTTDVEVLAHIAANATPAGAVLSFAFETPPTGWLECDGAALSRVSYADLFAAVGETFGAGDGTTTFNLPDLRGEFMRGWDHGRGVDAGRALGSAQTDEFKSHKHGLGYSTNYAGSPLTDVTSGVPTLYGAKSEYFTPMASAGGVETRPRNIALMFCIKY